jgi:aryl-alcohol dehydrogenase-like predicted oxidoreductase
MRYRPLGSTGLRVSEIGFGAWGIGKTMWMGAEDQESLRALGRAADLGINFFDTARVYGDGHSERLIGRFLKEHPGDFLVASKIPPKNGLWPARSGTTAAETFPRMHILRITEESLQNLGREVIDLMQFHVWSDEWVDDPEWFEGIQELKRQGKIRFFGVSINDHAPESALKLVASGKVDVVQVIYNIFDQSPEQELFGLCQKHGIGVIARVPFDEGGLTATITPETTFPERDWRNRYFRGERKREVFERGERLKELLGDDARTLPELALRFCLHHDAVSTVIPGMRTTAHVESNCAVSDGKKLSEGLVARLRPHAWKRNWY